MKIKELSRDWSIVLTKISDFFYLLSKTNEIIIDVRTPEEWQTDGHAACSVNYPLDEIQNKVDELKKYQHIILVCRSGNRAGIAKRQLENAGRMQAPFQAFYQRLNNDYSGIQLLKNSVPQMDHVGSKNPNIIKGLDFYFQNK